MVAVVPWAFNAKIKPCDDYDDYDNCDDYVWNC